MENWQRLEKLVKWTGMSINAFALHIGLKRSENLYQIKKGNHGISKELARVITEKYPNISKSWLLTGEGCMLKDEQEDLEEYIKKGIPFYNVDISALKDNSGRATKPVYYINIPIFDDSDFAALSTSTSMQPDIPSGAIVVLKEHDPKKILPGESYLIITDTFCGIRNIRRHASSESKLRLVPKNVTDFDEMTIETDEIKSLYIVKGVVINKTM